MTAPGRELAMELEQWKRVGPRSWLVASRSELGTAYRVDVAFDGTVLCNCPGHTFRQSCWHAKYLKEEIDMTTAEETRALVPIQLQPPVTTLPTERELSLIDRAAQLAFAGAVALPKELDTPQKVAAVMLYGWEIGLKPMTSIRQIYIIEGRPQPSAEVMAGLLIKNDATARLEVLTLTEDECTMRIRRPSRQVDATYSVKASDSDVKRLIERDKASSRPGGWTLYRRDRLRWHCTKRILRIYAPDAINGLTELEANTAFAAGEWQGLDDGDLYNAGDSRMVDTTTGEILEHEPAPEPGGTPAAQAAIDRIKALVKEIEESAGAEYVKVVKAGLRDGFQAFKKAEWADLLTADDAGRVIAYLEEANGAPPETAPEAQPTLV